MTCTGAVLLGCGPGVLRYLPQVPHHVLALGDRDSHALGCLLGGLVVGHAATLRG